MALRVKVLHRRLCDAREELRIAEEALEQIRAKETELETDIDRADSQEAMEAVETAVAQYEEQRNAAEQTVAEKREAVEHLERQLREAQERPEQVSIPGAGRSAPDVRQEGRSDMSRIAINDRTQYRASVRRIFGGMTPQERAEIFQRQEVRDWLENTRSVMRRDQRAIANVGLTIPDVMLDLLRPAVYGYSKLYKYIRLRAVRGNARQLLSTVPQEAIWTDCCANLNEMTMAFYQEEFDCWRVGGYYAVCNANLEDSDLDLAAEILSSLAESIGLALDKAILYGRNSSSYLKMPMGVVTRLAQESQPASYPATARPWADLHTANIKTIAANVTGAALFSNIILYSGAAKSRYSQGKMTWCMNELTWTKLLAEAVSINAAGAVVSGLGTTMPVIGGPIETLEFIPDYNIIGGYFDLYTLIERAGQKFASSEHVRFLQDQTVFKGTARYDGGPSIAEGFVLIGINNTSPSTTMTFAPDEANTVSVGSAEAGSGTSSGEQNGGSENAGSGGG